ncbi:MAG: hypothetical protein AABM29_09675 [Actinomycetota bacterium]
MRRSVLSGIALCAALIAAALPAAASADTVSDGSLALKLSGGFKGQLASNGVAMKPKSLALKGGPAGGELDPRNGQGSLGLRGKLTFKGNGHKLVFKSLLATLGPGGKLTGKAKGRKTTIFKLQGGNVDRDGFNATVTGIKAKLTGAAAKRVNKALELDSLHAGNAGTVTLREQPQDVQLQEKGRATLVASDEAAMQFLTASGGPVSASAIAPAEQEGLTTFHLPINGGTAAIDLTSGETKLAGGINQEQMFSGKAIDLFNLLLQWEPPGFVRADSTQFGTNGVAFIDKTTGSVSKDPQARTITFQNVTLRFNEAAANLTNLTFGTTFQPNDPLGTLSATLTAR